MWAEENCSIERNLGPTVGKVMYLVIGMDEKSHSTSIFFISV